MARRAVHVEAVAREAILREALPRLLRLAADPEAEAAALLAAVERRLRAASTGDVEAARNAAGGIIRAAAEAERTKRLGTLGTDGTP